MAARVANAEKRFNNAQNQLLLSEERISQMNQNRVSADGKWEARVKEYEARLKAAEEKVKRERQGSKERVLELENHVKYICLVSSPGRWLTICLQESAAPVRNCTEARSAAKRRYRDEQDVQPRHTGEDVAFCLSLCRFIGAVFFLFYSIRVYLIPMGVLYVQFPA